MHSLIEVIQEIKKIMHDLKNTLDEEYSEFLEHKNNIDKLNSIIKKKKIY